MEEEKYINKYMMKRKKLVKEDENKDSTSNNLIQK